MTVVAERDESHEWLSAQEVADLLRVGRDTVCHWLASGELPGTRVGRHWRLQKSEIEAQLLLQSRMPARRKKVGARAPVYAARVSYKLERLLTPKEFSDALSVPLGTVSDWIRFECIPFTKVAGRVYISQDVVDGLRDVGGGRRRRVGSNDGPRSRPRMEGGRRKGPAVEDRRDRRREEKRERRRERRRHRRYAYKSVSFIAVDGRQHTIYREKNGVYYWHRPGPGRKRLSLSVRTRPAAIREVNRRLGERMAVQDGDGNAYEATIAEAKVLYLDFLRRERAHRTATRSSSALDAWCEFARNAGW